MLKPRKPIKKVRVRELKSSQESIVDILDMLEGGLSSRKKTDLANKLSKLSSRELSELYIITKEQPNLLQRLNIIYRTLAKADEKRLVREREKNKIQISKEFELFMMPKLRELEVMARNGEIDKQSYIKFLQTTREKLSQGEITVQQYEKIIESKVNQLLGIEEPSNKDSKENTKKNKNLLMYGIIAVAGYLLYKKFKK